MKKKHNYLSLRDLYLRDLELPDTYHGRTKPKVRNPSKWKEIQPRVLAPAPIVIDPFGPRNVWVWSDIHWGHKNIIKYTAPHRPFNTVEEMNEGLIANYLKVVKSDDIVIFGGDIGFMAQSVINDILNRLPGYKIQIVGNHDMYRNGTLYDLDFDERHLCMVIDVVDDEITSQLLITHYPLDTVERGLFNLHGHIHQNVARQWNINMCVEHTNCAPMHIRDVIAKMKSSSWKSDETA